MVLGRFADYAKNINSSTIIGVRLKIPNCNIYSVFLLLLTLRVSSGSKNDYQKSAVLPLLSSLLAGFGGSAGRRGRAPPLLAGGVGLALLAIGCTGRLIRQTPCSAGSEGWRMRERAAE